MIYYKSETGFEFVTMSFLDSHYYKRRYQFYINPEPYLWIENAGTFISDKLLHKHLTTSIRLLVRNE